MYCYARSYMARFSPNYRSRPKRDLIGRILRDLRRIDKRLPINISTSSDPYPPEEEKLLLTRSVLNVLLKHGCRVLLTTKSSLFVRDIDIILGRRCAVMVTVTTLDDQLARVLEPGAPPPSKRIDAIARASEEGIPVGARIDPVIPYVNDDPGSLVELVKELHAAGVRHVVTSTYKADPVSFRRLTAALPELEERLRKLYFRDGERRGHYRYAPVSVRKKLLMPVIRTAEALGLTYATCREGLDLKRAPSCDGSHLIPDW